MVQRPTVHSGVISSSSDHRDSNRDTAFGTNMGRVAKSRFAGWAFADQVEAYMNEASTEEPGGPARASSGQPNGARLTRRGVTVGLSMLALTGARRRRPARGADSTVPVI